MRVTDNLPSSWKQGGSLNSARAAKKMHHARLRQQDNQAIFWYSEQKGTQGKKTCASVSLNSKILLMTSQRVPTKGCTTSSVFSPCSLELSIHFSVMMSTGTQVAASDTTTIVIEVGHIECLCLFFLLREDFFLLDKLYFKNFSA